MSCSARNTVKQKKNQNKKKAESKLQNQSKSFKKKKIHRSISNHKMEVTADQTHAKTIQ